MTTKLEKAISALEHLPENEQDAVAEWLLAEVESESRWDDLFGRSHDLLARLAAEALAEDRAGLTVELDPEKL